MTESAQDCLERAQERLVYIRSAARWYVAGIVAIAIAFLAISIASQSHLPPPLPNMAYVLLPLVSSGAMPLVGRFWKTRKLSWRFNTQVNRLSKAISRNDPHDSLHAECEDLEKDFKEV